METEIIKTDNPNIVIERTTTDREINITMLQEELDCCLVLLEEQEQICERLHTKLEKETDEEIKELIEKKISEVNENKRWNLIKINELTEKLK